MTVLPLQQIWKREKKGNERIMFRKLTLTVVIALFVTLTTTAGILQGKVTDSETGEALIGASVTFAEGKGISTDIEGCFTINIPDGKHTITIRYIGYKTQTKEVVIKGGTQTMDAALEPDNATLANVTVTGEARQETEAYTPH